MPETGNLYDIMGLPRYASIGEVKAAFRRLAVMYHPDKNPGDAVAEERFKSISAAYDILGDETKKRNYDLRLTGFYTYVKTESPEEKARKRREEVELMRRRKKEREEREIIEVYEEAKKRIAYKWRYSIAVILTVLALTQIITNWFAYTLIGSRESAFFLMLVGYIVSLGAVLFFLNSLFKKWNAQNIKKPFKFDIRNRIVLFFLLYLGFMISFSFTAPPAYKNAQLSLFGKTTDAIVYGGVRSNLVLIYEVEGKVYKKDLNIQRPYSGLKIFVTVRYSALQPFICEIISTHPPAVDMY